MDQLLNTPITDFFQWAKLRTPVWPDNNVPDMHVEKYTDFKLCEPKKRIGIEVEVEGIGRMSGAIDKYIWMTKADGSLRNNGCEFVTLPIAGRQVIYAVDNLFTNLPPTADFSERTSIHIHVNVREQTIGQILTLLMLYTVFEQLLFEFAGPQRKKNIFCVAIQETRYPYMIMNFLKNQSFIDLIMSWKKYSGLNLGIMRGLGTIEYRIMEGHSDPLRLLKWINILLRMHQYVRVVSFKQAYEEIRTLNTSSMYEQFVRNVFKSDADDLLKNVYNLQQLLEVGVSSAKTFGLPSEFLTSLTSKVSTDSLLLKQLEVKEYPPVAKKSESLFSEDMLAKYVANFRYTARAATAAEMQQATQGAYITNPAHQVGQMPPQDVGMTLDDLYRDEPVEWR